MIQPLAPPPAPRARPVRCQGFDFTFTHEHDRLAFVSGQTGATFVAVDGAQVYPRRGRTVVASAPAWSKDGRRLAFLELPPDHAPRLVLVAAIDDPAGDVSWDLPDRHQARRRERLLGRRRQAGGEKDGDEADLLGHVHRRALATTGYRRDLRS